MYSNVIFKKHLHYQLLFKTIRLKMNGFHHLILKQKVNICIHVSWHCAAVCVKRPPPFWIGDIYEASTLYTVGR